MKYIIFLLILVLVGGVLGPVIVQAPLVILAAIFGAFLLVLALTNFEVGLMLLLFIIPLSVQVNVQNIKGGAPVDVGADDFFIFCLFMIWLVYLAKTKQAPFAVNPLTWPFLLYFGACLLSFLPLIFSGKGKISLSFLHLLKWYEYVFIYFVVVKCLENRGQIIRFTVLSIASCAFIAGVQVLQILFGLTHGEAEAELGTFAMSSFESNGILGAFYVFFLSIVLSFWVSSKETGKKLLLLALALLLSVTLFYTYARAAYLGMVVSMIVLGFLYRKRFLFISILLLLLSPAFFSKAVSERISMTVKVDTRTLADMGYRTPHAGHYTFGSKAIQLDESSYSRLLAWAKAKNLIYQHPLFGTGYWSVRYLGVFGFSTAHNHYVTVLVETGVLGFLSFLAICAALLFNTVAFARTTRDPFYHALAKGVAAGFIGILVHSFFGESFESFRLTGPLWIMAGIVFAAKRIEQMSYQAPEWPLQTQ